MANLCREAALGPIRDAAHNIQHITPDEVRKNNYYNIYERERGGEGGMEREGERERARERERGREGEREGE